MYVDALLQFSDAQAVTGSVVSTNSVDFGAARDLGTGKSVYLVVSVDTALTDSGSDSTVTVRWEGDSTSTITPDQTQDLFTIPALAAAGQKYIAKLDPGQAATSLRFAQLRYVVNGGDLSTGAFTAFLTEGIDQYTAYADGFTIS